MIEAHEARVPLIVLTADRPPELREVGAGQTIDQLKLYGDAVKWFFEVGVHEATAGAAALGAHARLPGVLDGASGPARARASQLPAARAARPRRRRCPLIGPRPRPDGAAVRDRRAARRAARARPTRPRATSVRGGC